MGFLFHLGGALSGVGQEAFKARQQQHEDELRQQAQEYQALTQLAQNASPEYQNIAFKHMLDYAMAKPGTPGDKQRQTASSGILQLVGGQSPETQYTNTSVGGDPRYAATVPNQQAQPQGQMPLGGGSNLAQLLGGFTPSSTGGGGNDLMDRVHAPSPFVNQAGTAPFGAPSQGAPLASPGFQSQASDQTISNFGQGFAGASPNVQTPIPQPRTPQLMTQTGTAPVVTARTPIPFLEDAVARKVREAKGLMPVQAELYGLKKADDLNNKIQTLREKGRVDLAVKLKFLPEQMRAQALAQGSRELVKTVINNGGSMDNPQDVQDAVDQIAEDTKQRFDEHAARIAEANQRVEASKANVETAKGRLQAQQDALELRKKTEGDSVAIRKERVRLSQIANDLKPMEQRLIGQRAKIARLSNDPRLMASEDPNAGNRYNPATTGLKRQLADETDKLQQMEADYQSASEGRPGGAIADRAAAGGGAPAGGKIISAAELQKYATDNGVSIDKAKEAYLHNARQHGLTITFQ